MSSLQPTLRVDRTAARRDRRPAIVRPAASPLALEARLMFDGEALEASQRWATLGGSPIDALSGEHSPADLPVIASADPAPASTAVLDLSSLREPSDLHAAVDRAADDATGLLRSLAAKSDFADLLRSAFGNAGTSTNAFQAAAEELRSAILNGQFVIKVELRGFSDMKGFLAAYAASSPDGTERIYLNRDWISLGITGESLTQALLQELGHAIDQRLNGGRDSAGDEGELFARLAIGEQLSPEERLRLTGSNDAVLLSIDGLTIPAEHATITFTTVYADNDATSYTTSTNAIAIGASGIGASSFSFTSADPSQTTFSGNDIAGQLSYTLAGANYVINGVISRRATTTGVVDGFYFVETTVLGGNTSTGNAYLMVIPGREAAVVASKNNKNEVGTDSAGVDTALNSFITTQSTNAEPVITSNGGGATASISIPENTTAVTTVTSTDANASDTKAYSITGGAAPPSLASSAPQESSRLRRLPTMRAQPTRARTTSTTSK